jgi:phosphate/sulfate permease
LEDEMPYKDPERKKQWEFQHRARRIARRHQLRRIETEQQAEQPPPSDIHSGILWVPIAGSVALAICSPKSATGIGALLLILAAALKKDWRWWLVGVIAIVLGLFFYWNDAVNTRFFAGSSNETEKNNP